jgi:predicted dehydrogenase
MLKIGIVGFGFMGRMHFANWQQMDDCQVVAICDTNPDVKKSAAEAVGNIEGAAQAIDFDTLKIYSDFDTMLSEAGLDAVSIALPTHLHAAFSTKALAAGVHVLCEKPMALTLDECDRMMEAAQESGKILQIGHCVRFWPEYAKAREIVQSGKYGPVRAAMLQRLSAPPTWSVDGWLADEKLSGSVALDLHIHDTDYALYLLGTPSAVQSSAVRAPKTKSMLYIVTNYLYGDSAVVTAEGSWAMTPSFGFEMSFNILLESATLVYDCTRDPAFRICPAEGEPILPEVASHDGYWLEIEHFMRRVKGEDVATVTTLEQSRESVRIVQAEIESADRGQAVTL